MKVAKNQMPHIGIFGVRNVGKSSFINALTGQQISIVADYAGTTTDPVKKSFELGECGPVVLIDTAGIDDTGELGQMRVAATQKTLKQIDLALLLFTGPALESTELALLELLEKEHTPVLLIHHKSDQGQLDSATKQAIGYQGRTEVVEFSSCRLDALARTQLVRLIAQYLPQSAFNNPSLMGDLVAHGDLVVLVTPIDKEAPKGRLILPQVQAIRDGLDNDCVVVVTKERELEWTLKMLERAGVSPRLVVTDSQEFLKVDALVPPSIALTSFSILFARLKGDFDLFVRGTFAISKLKDGDRVVILESCSHHAVGDDIGRVKIPRWLTNFTGKQLEFDIVTSFNDLPHPPQNYALFVQCGGCMFTRKQLLARIRPALDHGIPVTNYGMTIAYTQGIFQRAVRCFGIEASSQL